MLLAVLPGCRAEQQVGQTEEGRLVLGTAEVEEMVERSVGPGSRTLVLEGFNGTVQLRGSDGPSADLAFVKRGRGENEAAARRALEEVRLIESGNDREYRYAVQAGQPNVTEVDVHGEVPRGTSLRLRSEHATVLLSGIEGAITVRNTHGSVQIAGASRRVEVQVRSGDVALGLRRLTSSEAVRVRTQNGSITVTLPAGSSAQVEAETEAGDVLLQGLGITEQRFRPDGAGARFSGLLGRGESRIRLQTVNGDITLREGQLFELPIFAPPPPTRGLPALPPGDSLAAPGAGTPAPRPDSLPPDSLRRAAPGTGRP